MPFVNYSLNSCCPEFWAECDELTPVMDVFTRAPTIVNNNGSINITFRGLLSTFRVQLDNRPPITVIGQWVFDGLGSGTYSVKVSSLQNPKCVWTFAVRVPVFDELRLELYYRDFLTTPVPKLPSNVFDTSNTTVFPDDYRSNSDRVIIPGQNGIVPQNGFNICFMLVIEGGEEPYNILWEDFRDYGFVPVQLITPITPAQALNNQLNNQRPPIINGVNGGRNMCYNLTPNNGNGWGRVTVTDSAVVPATKIIWIYIREAVLP